jgi:hypothetical protein
MNWVTNQKVDKLAAIHEKLKATVETISNVLLSVNVCTEISSLGREDAPPLTSESKGLIQKFVSNKTDNPFQKMEIDLE